MRRQIHAGITCDACGVSPIVGARYRCVVCPDFDLCEACDRAQVGDAGDHRLAHDMLKMRQPARMPPAMPPLGPVRPRVPVIGDPYVPPYRRDGHPGVPPPRRDGHPDLGFGAR